jgi:hypothetical protein
VRRRATAKAKAAQQAAPEGDGQDAARNGNEE